MNKRFLQVISAALCVLLLAGCGAKAEDSAGTADDGQQWGPPAQDGFDEPVYRTTIFGSMPYEAPPRRADKVWDGAAWVDPSGPGGDAADRCRAGRDRYDSMGGGTAG